jgi:hypothetical protein
MVVRVPTGGDGGEGVAVGHIEDTIHDFVVDTIPADRDDQWRPRRSHVAGKLTGMIRALGRQ